jgi:hypothetical protein
MLPLQRIEDAADFGTFQVWTRSAWSVTEGEVFRSADIRWFFPLPLPEANMKAVIQINIAIALACSQYI